MGFRFQEWSLSWMARVTLKATVNLLRQWGEGILVEEEVLSPQSKR